jgi:FtsP/CotA-like multicopper oxidase with cupredoxin domain
VMLMPGERVDVWGDFGKLAGKQVILSSLSFKAGGMGGGGMGGGGMGSGGMGSTLSKGAAFNILTVNVGRKATANPVLGPLPALSVRYSATNVPNYAAPRPFTLDVQRMTWRINGRVYDPLDVAEDEMVYRDETMAWEWVNNSPIPHPMHMHNVMFQVVQRNAAATPSSYSTVNQGFVDSGWKDTVLVWPGERVKIAMTFGPHMGMYMYHCHILEHEDMTMMRNYMIMDPMMPSGSQERGRQRPDCFPLEQTIRALISGGQGGDMLSKSIGIALFVVFAACLSIDSSKAHAHYTVVNIQNSVGE